ncbi:hypothetical protein CD113_06730 [Staphylococcus simiae]|nr:hypothetical protein CD113_06730 [Staphylococcus simiae]
MKFIEEGISKIKQFIYNKPAYFTPFLLILLAIYFSIFTFYISQYSIKLKTIHNLESDYDEQIVKSLKEGNKYDRKR